MKRREILMLLALVGTVTFTIGRWSSSGPAMAQPSQSGSLSVSVVSESLHALPHRIHFLKAECPAGSHATGGGFSGAKNIWVTHSQPDGTSGWKAQFESVRTAPEVVHVWASCATLTP